MKSLYIYNGTNISITNSTTFKVENDLAVSNYLVRKDERTGDFYLVETESFQLLKKYYGDTEKKAERILSTYVSRNTNTGVLLSGEKGSGKSLLAKLVSIEARKLNMPTIMINETLFGDVFNNFISSIDTRCVILFDEFEKIYNDREQQQILTLLDGGVNCNHLFMFTSNSKFGLNSHMLNRPGRIYYSLEYDGLDRSFIEEYCLDRKIGATIITDIIKISTLFPKFNFDMLQAIVDEHIRYGESPFEVIRFVNARPENEVVDYGNRYNVSLFDPRGKKIKAIYPLEYAHNPLNMETFTIEIEDNSNNVPKDDILYEADIIDNITFTASDMNVINISEGLFELVNQDGYKCVLKKPASNVWDYKKLLI